MINNKTSQEQERQKIKVLSLGINLPWQKIATSFCLQLVIAASTGNTNIRAP